MSPSAAPANVPERDPPAPVRGRVVPSGLTTGPKVFRCLLDPGTLEILPAQNELATDRLKQLQQVIGRGRRGRAGRLRLGRAGHGEGSSARRISATSGATEAFSAAFPSVSVE